MGLTIFKQFFHKTSISLSSKFQGQGQSKKGRRDRWLFHATDFQSLMNPCFAFCRILGIFPYKINGTSFETSKLWCSLSTIVMCVFCFCALVIIMDISGWFNVQNERKTIELYSFYIFGSFITIVTYVLSGPQVRLLQTILRNSSRLPSKTYQEQSVVIHIKDIVGFFFLLVFSLICYPKMRQSILTKVSSFYITLVVFQMNMLYINCVCVLKACFKKINFDLANLLIINDKPHLVRWICHEQRNHFLLIELKALKKQYLMVSDSVRVLNIIFSPQLLATIAMVFIEITFELYFNLVQWQNGLSLRCWKQAHSIYIIIYIVYYLVKIALIAWACETGKNEATKISTTIHDVLNSTNDEQIKHELQLFSLQIMHCDNTFSAKGLTLDATLVTAMTGTTSTYFLILMQFLIASHSCDGRTAINVTQALN